MVDRILKLVEERIDDGFGDGVGKLASNRLALRKNLESELEEEEKTFSNWDYEAEDDVEFIASEFVKQRLYDLNKLTKGRSDHKIVSSSGQRGSLQNLQAYATALPIAVKARRALFAHPEPLLLDAAVEWLRENADARLDEWCTELTLTARIPHSWEREVAALRHRNDLDGAMDVLEDIRRDVLRTRFSAKNLGPRRIYLLGNVPPFEFREQPGSVPGDDAEWESIPLEGGPLEDLANYAERLVKQCGGEDVEGFERAVWLILIGKWYSIGAVGLHDEFRDWHLIHDPREVVNRPAPHATLRIFEMETTPSEVEDLYRQVRARMNVASPGPKVSRRNELLGLLAVDVATLEGKQMGDRGFTRSVLARWREAAPRYGFAEDEFSGIDAIRYALTGLRKQIEKQDQAIVPNGPGVVRSGLFW